MKLDIGSITFNMNIEGGGGTPSWGTALGQNSKYNYSVSGVEELLTSMVYCTIDTNKVFCPLGKGGNQQQHFHYEIASLYKKIYANGILIPNAKFVLLIVKKIEGDNHVGRRTLKYNSKITYNNENINEDCFKKIAQELGISENGSWFVHSLFTKNQDELHFEVVVADSNKSLLFKNSDERKKYIFDLLEKNGVEKTIDENVRLTKGYNKIVYGIPGCGKSWYVENNIIKNDINYGKTFRTTFYPDYTNSDFIGQIVPQINHDDKTSVLYNIQKGPFLEALEYSIVNPKENVYLVIEEINRGNAAAIFGDTFQLLDRHKKNGENDILKDNTSEYSIKNYIITTSLKMELDDKYNIKYDLENIRIPSNMIIIGTMNTCDQNVFTLDTAFKRRWQMEYIKNDLFNSKYANELLPGTTITWAKFVEVINTFITDSEIGINMNGEDKQIGAYFISGDEWSIMKKSSREVAARYFAEKVLSYIWDDVAKINREDWFDSKKYKTLESVINGYIDNGLNVFGDNLNFNESNNE